MSDYFPHLDIKQAIADADRNLADVVYYVDTLYDESAGHYPRQAEQLLARIAFAREVLARLIPPECQEDIATEQARYDAEEAAWSE
jgi:hypothetical protein